MAERVLKAQETGTSGKHEASFIHWDSRFSACYIFFIYWGGRGLLCLPFIDSDTLNSNTVKWY